jgi:hypothetical protein
MSSRQSISFDAIVKGRDASVRVSDDNLLYAVDLVAVMTGKNCNDSNECLRDLNAFELIMVLPGKIAKETRSQFADIIRRYLAGDSTLSDELRANEASDTPLARLARASLKRDRETVLFDLEVAERKQSMELEGAERRQKLKESEERMHTSKQARLRDAVDLLSTLCDKDLDERTRLQIEDYTKNWLAAGYGIQQQQQANIIIQDGGAAAAAAVSQTASLTVSLVAGDMGRRKCTPAQLIAIGKAMAKSYRDKYNADPPTHAQEARGGKIIRVNSYMERDRDLMEAAIRACVPLVDQ